MRSDPLHAGDYEGLCLAVAGAFEAMSVQFVHSYEADSWHMSFDLPDMVPALRTVRLRWSGDALRENPSRAIQAVLREAGEAVGRERETRRWAAVDP